MSRKVTLWDREVIARHAVALRDALIAGPVGGVPVVDAPRETLFAAIAHGDAEHRAWLKEAIDAHFAGRPVPKPRAAAPSVDAPELLELLKEVQAERARQDAKWGGADHDDEHTTAEFVQLIEDYAGWARTMAGMSSPLKARNRLLQVAALAVAACQSIDRRITAKVGGQAMSKSDYLRPSEAQIGHHYRCQSCRAEQEFYCGEGGHSRCPCGGEMTFAGESYPASADDWDEERDTQDGSWHRRR